MGVALLDLFIDFSSLGVAPQNPQNLSMGALLRVLMVLKVGGVVQVSSSSVSAAGQSE